MKTHLPNLPAVATAAAVFIALGIALSSPASGQDTLPTPSATPPATAPHQLPQLLPQGPSPEPPRKPRLPPLPVSPTPLPEQQVFVSLPDTGLAADPNRPAISVDGLTIRGLPHDWTHNYLKFSNPGTEEDAIKNGKHNDWLRIVNEPRYIIQQLQRHAPVQGPHAAEVAALEALPPPADAPQDASAINPDRLHKRRKLHKDWSESVGAGALLPITFPAKYSFSTTSASCSDLVVVPTGVAGSASAATVIGYTNIYSGCGGTVPTVKFSINTGTGYAITLSPVFSASGTQIALVQTSGTASGLTASSEVVVLQNSGGTWGIQYTGSTFHNDGSTTDGSTVDYYSNPFYDYNTDTLYTGDNIDDIHAFHPVFTSTLVELDNEGGTTVAPWWEGPYYAYAATPVVDPTTGCLFVGDMNGYLYSINSRLSGSTCSSTSQGTTHETTADNSTTCGSTSSARDFSGIVDGPLVDSAQGRVYVASGDFESSSVYYDVLAQYPTTFGSGAGWTTGDAQGNSFRKDGTCRAVAAPLHYGPGAFDNIYLETTGGYGHIYNIGGIYPPTTLFQSTISADALAASTTGNTITNTGYFGQSPPVTEFCNNAAAACVVTGAAGSGATTSGTDYLFVGAYYSAVSQCPSQSTSTGCVMSFNISSSSSFSGSMTPVGETSVAVVSTATILSPTTAYIIDNSVPSGTESGASEVYFLQLDNALTCATSGGTGICAIQATQAAP